MDHPNTLGRASEAVPGALPVGAYEAMAWRAGLPNPTASGPARARRVFLVHEPGQELARVDADPGERRLAALAAATGGRALLARTGDTLPTELPLADLGAENPHLRVDSRRAVPLWDGPWALLSRRAGFRLRRTTRTSRRTLDPRSARTKTRRPRARARDTALALRASRRARTESTAATATRA